MSNAPRMSAEEIAQRSFSSARRGLSEPEVRSFLRRVADDVMAMREKIQESAARIAELEEQLRNPPPPTEEQLLVSLGAETARVLRSAQEAAEEIRTNAAERAETQVREATEAGDRIRREAEEAAEQRTREAGEAASKLEQETAEAAAKIRADAENEATDLREQASAEAEAEVEAARTRGREMLAEARAVRERMLTDLERRKAAAHAEMEAMRVGRERLLEVYRAAQGLLSEATATLDAAEPPAPPAGDRPRAAARSRDAASRAETTTGPEAAAETGEAAGPDAGPQPRVAGDAAEVFARLRAASDVRPAETPPPSPEDEVDLTERGGHPGTGNAGGATAVPDAESGTEAESDGEAEPDGDTAGRDAAARGAEGSGDRTSRDLDQGRLRHRDTALAPLHRNLARRSKRMLQDEQNALLDRLRTAGGKVDPESMLVPRSDVLAAWAELVRTAVDQAFAGGRASVSDQPVSEPVTAPDDLVSETASALVEPLRERLEAALSGGVAGDTPDDTADDTAGRVNARYREWKRQDLDGRVGDLLAVAWARGVFDAVPAGKPLRWVPEESGRCPDCDDNGLQATPRGEAFPTGQPHPPAHPGCRCLLVPADGPAEGDGASLAAAAGPGTT